MSLGQHVILHLADDRVLAPTTAARRRLARTVLRVGDDFGLLAFRTADTHLHVEASCAETSVRELVRRLRIALFRALRLPVGFRAPTVRPIENQAHLARAFAYIFRQEPHHGTDSDPLFDASNLPDLLGLRLLGGAVAARVGATLPRVTRAMLLEHLGTPDLDAIDPSGLDDLEDAAAGAFGLPRLVGRSSDVAKARHAAASALHRRASTATIAAALRLSESHTRNLLARPAPAAAVRAVRQQLALRAVVRARMPRR